MQLDELILRIRERISNPATIHDFAKWQSPKPYPKASAESVSAAETSMKCQLPDLLKRLLLEVANGGFGPGYGLIGVGKGYPDFGNGSLENLYAKSHSKDGNFRIIIEEAHVVPFCNWGCAIYSCLDLSGPSTPVLIYNPKINFFGIENIRSVEVRDARGELKSKTTAEVDDGSLVRPAPKLLLHKESFEDWMSAWADGVRLWDEMESLWGAN